MERKTPKQAEAAWGFRETALHHEMLCFKGQNINDDGSWSTADAEKRFGMWPGASLVEGNGHTRGATSPVSAGQPPSVHGNCICCYRHSTVITSLTAEISPILTNITHSLQSRQLKIVQSFLLHTKNRRGLTNT